MEERHRGEMKKMRESKVGLDSQPPESVQLLAEMRTRSWGEQHRSGVNGNPVSARHESRFELAFKGLTTNP